MRRAAAIVVALVLPCLLTGCHDATHSGDTTTIVLAFWIRLLTVLCPLLVVAGLLGLCFLPRRLPTLRLVMRIIATILLILFALPTCLCGPMVFADTITISPTEFTRVTGFWFAPTRVTVKLSDIDHVAKETRHTVTGRLDTAWIVHLKSGGEVRIPPGDLGRSAEHDVRLGLVRHGIDLR